MCGSRPPEGRAVSHSTSHIRHPTSGFTLVELLLTISILALLVGLLLPALSSARAAARTASCLSNQRQMAIAWTAYANDHKGMAMPLEVDASDSLVYWFGAVSLANSTVDHERGFLSPYLASDLRERSVFECPSQPWGTYRAQPIAVATPRPTSTYGYNGYYLCPPATPGWRSDIGAQRWKSLADIDRPSELFVFADTILPAATPINCALLDPPLLFSAGNWSPNLSPTTSFRHGKSRGTEPGSAGSVVSAQADGSARATPAIPAWLTHPRLGIGSAGTTNDPHYVPDWRSWR
jgi:prepilin-type N-terminal cleavage/methylation domain-containing protein